MSSNGSLAQRSVLLSRLWITHIDWPFQQNGEIPKISGAGPRNAMHRVRTRSEANSNRDTMILRESRRRTHPVDPRSFSHPKRLVVSCG
jgi:hypothetical protein